GRRQDAADGADQRRLAGSVGADDAERGAFLDREAHVLEGLHLPDRPLAPAEADDGLLERGGALEGRAIRDGDVLDLDGRTGAGADGAGGDRTRGGQRTHAPLT